MINRVTRRKFYFYKSWHSVVRFIDLLPVLKFSKNVQGWTFMRTWTFNWFTYAVSFVLSKTDFVELGHNEAHEANVKKYINKIK